MDRVDVAIIGAGQAGLATSHELSAAGVEHVVLEKGRVGETWRGRWETFCLKHFSLSPRRTLRATALAPICIPDARSAVRRSNSRIGAELP